MYLVVKDKKTRYRPSNFFMVRVKGLEPPCLAALDPKSSASANFATLAEMVDLVGLEPTTARL